MREVVHRANASSPAPSPISPCREGQGGEEGSVVLEKRAWRKTHLLSNSHMQEKSPQNKGYACAGGWIQAGVPQWAPRVWEYVGRVSQR